MSHLLSPEDIQEFLNLFQSIKDQVTAPTVETMLPHVVSGFLSADGFTPDDTTYRSCVNFADAAVTLSQAVVDAYQNARARGVIDTVDNTPAFLRKQAD